LQFHKVKKRHHCAPFLIDRTRAEHPGSRARSSMQL
jgi:hypothetical protein